MEGRRIYVKHPSYYDDSLSHSGRKGMHWGERLYQYPDGSLTPLGRIHYGVGAARQAVSEHAKRLQNEDGTLTTRGKIHYKTMDKYKLMTDDQLRQQTNRLQLQKNLEQLKKDTSGSYRLKSKLENVAEEAIVSGSKRAVDKVINHYVDKKLGEYLNKETIEASKKVFEEVRKNVESMSTKDLGAYANRMKAEKNYVEAVTGKKLPSDYKYTDLPNKEKEGLKKSNQQPNQNSSENNSEASKVSEEKKVPETKSSEKKKEENTEEPRYTSKGMNWGARKYQNEDGSLTRLGKLHYGLRKEKPKTENKSSTTISVKRTDSNSQNKSESKKNDSSGSEIKSSDVSRMKAMRRGGQSIQQIAMVMKLSPSTVEKYLKG